MERKGVFFLPEATREDVILRMACEQAEVIAEPEDFVKVRGDANSTLYVANVLKDEIMLVLIKEKRDVSYRKISMNPV